MMTAHPWKLATALDAETFARVRMRTIFECHKYDPQVEDHSILTPYPLILSYDTWQELAGLAEKLAAEGLAAELELIGKPHLHRELALPDPIVKLFKHPVQRPSQDARVIRFDFHLTPDGWRISEANVDTPAGYNESAGFTAFMAAYYPVAAMTGNPAAALAQAISESVGAGARVGMLHPTSFVEDQQILRFLMAFLEREGLLTTLASPAHIRWQNGHVISLNNNEQFDYFVRFFPAEWLPNLWNSSPWQDFFRQPTPPSTNPVTTLLVQSKRFPLIWDRLQTPLPTWRTLLPETRDLRQVKLDDGWVLKPAFGRMGENILIPGVTGAKEADQIRKKARRYPDHWIAQRRFEPLPLGEIYPCIGVYTVNGRAAGTYGRWSLRPITDSSSRDIAVLTEKRNLYESARTF
jgi:glutathionylspermidine synthase